MFDEGCSTEVELLLAYYTLLGRVLDKVEEQLGRLIPNIVGKEIIQVEREIFSLPLRMGGFNITFPQDILKNLEKSIELSTLLASVNNDSFEIQQCEIEQTKISLRQKADMQCELISKKSRIENNLSEMKYTIQLASEKGASSLTRFRYQKMVSTSRRLSSVME